MSDNNIDIDKDYQIEKLLRPVEIAGILNISRSFAYRLLQTGQIRTVRLGKSCRVRPKDLKDYILTNIHSRENKV